MTWRGALSPVEPPPSLGFSQTAVSLTLPWSPATSQEKRKRKHGRWALLREDGSVACCMWYDCIITVSTHMHTHTHSVSPSVRNRRIPLILSLPWKQSPSSAHAPPRASSDTHQEASPRKLYQRQLSIYVQCRLSSKRYECGKATFTCTCILSLSLSPLSLSPFLPLLLSSTSDLMSILEYSPDHRDLDVSCLLLPM